MSGVVEMVRHMMGLVAALLIGAAAHRGRARGASPIPALFQTPFYCGVTSAGFAANSPKYWTDCSTAVEPKEWQAYGDGSAWLANLRWTNWGSYQPEGTGTLYLRAIDYPDPGIPRTDRTSEYGQGYYRLPVDVTLDYPVAFQDHYVYGVVRTDLRLPDPCNLSCAETHLKGKSVATQTFIDLWAKNIVGGAIGAGG